MARIAFLNERMLRGFGVDLVIHALASELAARGHEVTVYASVVGDLGPHRYRLERLPDPGVCSITALRALRPGWASYLDAGDHDLLFIESFPFFSLIPRLRTTTVAVETASAPAWGCPLPGKLISPTCVLASSVCSSPGRPRLSRSRTMSALVCPGGARPPGQVIYYGVDHYPKALPSAREEMRSRLGTGPEEVLALYVGRLNPEGQPYKGTADLMAAAAAWREQAAAVRPSHGRARQRG